MGGQTVSSGERRGDGLPCFIVERAEELFPIDRSVGLWVGVPVHQLLGELAGGGNVGVADIGFEDNAVEERVGGFEVCDGGVGLWGWGEECFHELADRLVEEGCEAGEVGEGEAGFRGDFTVDGGLVGVEVVGEVGLGEVVGFHEVFEIVGDSVHGVLSVCAQQQTITIIA